MPRRRRFRDRRFYPLRWLLNFFVLLAGAWGVGFLAFMVVVWAESPPNPIPHADGIVALTGGDGRVSAALALLAERAAPALLISGAGPIWGILPPMMRSPPPAMPARSRSAMRR